MGVVIRDGEIVREDAPATARQAAPAHHAPVQAAPARAPPADAGAAPAFDFSAPPVAVARDVEPLFGFVPELRVFGARLTGLHLALMAGALLLYGAKGLLLGAVVWAVYTLSQRPQGPADAATRPAPGGQAGTASGGAGFSVDALQRYFTSPPAGRAYRSGPAQLGGGGSSGGGGGPAPSARSSWENRGSGQRLGGSGRREVG